MIFFPQTVLTLKYFVYWILTKFYFHYFRLVSNRINKQLQMKRIVQDLHVCQHWNVCSGDTNVGIKNSLFKTDLLVIYLRENFILAVRFHHVVRPVMRLFLYYFKVVYLEHCQASKMERFMKIVSSFNY